MKENNGDEMKWIFPPIPVPDEGAAFWKERIFRLMSGPGGEIILLRAE